MRMLPRLHRSDMHAISHDLFVAECNAPMRVNLPCNANIVALRTQAGCDVIDDDASPDPPAVPNRGREKIGAEHAMEIVIFCLNALTARVYYSVSCANVIRPIFFRFQRL